jgi:hypothetical protein
MMSRVRIWKRQMVCLMMLAVWVISGIAAAQVRPPRRKHRIMVSEQPKKKTDATVGVSNSLLEIAQQVSRNAPDGMVELVLIIDGSGQMDKSIVTIEKQLVEMAGVFEEALIDYRFAYIWFQRQKGASQITVQQFSNNLSALQESIRQLRLISSEPTAGYGLDAIMQGLRELEFRSLATKHFVLVTNAPLQTTWTTKDAEKQVVKKIVGQCKSEKVHIHVIGIGERAQGEMATQTGGKWYAIDAYQRKPTQSMAMIDKSILKIDGIFKRIAEHIAETAKPAADIVFIFDSSLSMESKVDEICNGVDEMEKILETEGLDVRFGVIRFWASVGGGESVVTVTKPPLSIKQVKGLFQIPKQGDEHLLDAVIEGVPKLKTPEDRQLVLVIVTDEASSRRREKGYTAEQAIAICRGARAQVNVIGGVNSMNSASLSDTFQKRVATVTRGLHYIMPGSTIADERR